MKNKWLFTCITSVFWVMFAVLIGLDALQSSGSNVEPPPIALGSGQAASGGHCSGR